MSTFSIKTENFEGPLDLLLSLIEKRKLLINDFSLSKVSDEFIQYIESKDEFPVKESSDFILIASTLLLIKSKSLLPNLDLSEEEKSDIHNLEKRLRIYKIIKDSITSITGIFGKNILFSAEKRKFDPVFAPDESMKIENIYPAILKLIENLPKKETVPEAKVRKIISLEEMIDSLGERIERSLKMSFKDFTRNQKERVNVIVGFLAMLELVKRGIITARQEKHFSDIELETGSINVPKY